MTLMLTLGANQINRQLDNADELLRTYRQTGDIGYEYITYQPITSRDKLVPEDLAVTLLVNSRAGYRAFQSIRDNATDLDLTRLPNKSLADTSDGELHVVADVVRQVAKWSGFGASLATKVLHKKRPNLIPILDNQAIFGAYMNPNWPEQRSWQETIKSHARILEALRWIRYDIQSRENMDTWLALHAIEPNHSRIQLFDSVWWSYFRKREPVHNKS